MPDDVKISEMSEAASLDNSAQFPYVQSMNGNLTTLKAPLSQIGTKINEGMTFSNLQTTSKTIVGAINEAAQGGGVDYATELPISPTDPTDTKSYIDTKTTLIKSASGDLITISDGGDNIPLKSCNITIEPDLSGKTEANLAVCGKNLVVASDLRATATHDSVTFTKTDIGRFNVSGTNGNATYGGYLSNNASILLKANHTYRISGNWSGLTPSSSTVRVDLRYGSTIYLHENTESFTPTNDIVCYLGYRINANYSVPNGTICSPCVTVDNSDTTYEAYNGTTYNIPFGQTVTAGGTLDVISGELVVGGVTTQLTPVSPKTISGVNNIYNDCGDTDIEYFTENADSLAALFEVLSNS